MKQFKNRAIFEAKRRSKHFEKLNDPAGAETWSKIAAAIDWLQSPENTNKDTPN